MRDVIGEVPRLIDAEFAIAYRPFRQEQGWGLGLFETCRLPDAKRFKTAAEAFLTSAPSRFAPYDAERPEPRQRNRVLRVATLMDERSWMKVPIVRDLMVPFGLHRFDEVRTLICDGPSLLAWVGGFRMRPFSSTAMAALAELSPALKARLRLERQLLDARVSWEGLTLAVDSLPAPAFLLANKRIEYANATGRFLLQRDRRAIQGLLAGPPSERISRNVIAANGVTSLGLCVIHEPASDLDVRLARKGAAWGLTCAESGVVASLVLGDANKTVAAKVGRTEATIEFHVTRILKKAGVSSRSELVAVFWTDP